MNTRISRFLTVPALLLAGTIASRPAHAGFLDKLQDKMDKVTRPVDDAQRKVDEGVQRATAPVQQARDKTQQGLDRATAPVRRVQGKVANAQMQMMAMKQKMFNARSLAQGALKGDPALRQYALRTIVSPDNKVLRLVGTVSTVQEKARALQLAARYAPGHVVNQIKLIPATIVANTKATAVQTKMQVKSLKRPLR